MALKFVNASESPGSLVQGGPCDLNLRLLNSKCYYFHNIWVHPNIHKRLYAINSEFSVEEQWAIDQESQRFSLVDLVRDLKSYISKKFPREANFSYRPLLENRCSKLKKEKAMASHSSTLAWKIPRMEEPGGLQPMGSLKVEHNWATSLSLFTFMYWGRKWQPTPVFLPGEPRGRWSLVGCCLWGCTESDATEAT